MGDKRIMDVLIAGAGPVGLSLALALSRKGISVCVFEVLDQLSNEARASTFHPPTLEMFDEWGIAGEVVDAGLVIENLQFWERETKELVADFPYKLIAADTKYPCRLQCPQSEVTRIILPHVQRSEYGNVVFGHEFVEYTESAEGITAIVQAEDGLKQFQGRYLIGCDGAFSKVREGMGISFDGKTYEDRFLLVSSDIDLSDVFPKMGRVAYIFDPREWVIVMTLPDAVRIVFRLAPEESSAVATDEQNVRRRIAGFVGEQKSYVIKGISTYHVHQRITERFRKGRVVLAGDAAHINNPTGGMGMNSGIHDAHLLANALESVITGSEDESALDTYAMERKRVAREMIQQVTDRNYKELSAKVETARESRNREMRAAAADSDLAREFLLRTAMLSDRI